MNENSFKIDKNITILAESKFKINDTVQVIGKVTEFQSRLFVSADKIEKVN